MKVRKRLAGIPKQYITVVSNAAGRTALTPVDGDLVVQRDTDTLYEWDAPTSTWLVIGASTVPTSTTETNSIKSTLNNNVLSSVVKLSSSAPSNANVAVINSANADGIQGQVAKSDIQAAAQSAIANTKSISLAAVSGNLTANLNLSVAAADVGYTAVALVIRTDGLSAQLNTSTLYGLFGSANSAIQYANGQFTFVPGNVSHGSLANLTSSDDHTQYALLAGRIGGQTLSGGKAAADGLTLSSTTHATKGSILFGTSRYDEVNNFLGIKGTPVVELDVAGALALRKGTDNASTGTLADVPTANFSLLRFTGASVLNSLAGGVDGKVLILVNKNSSALTVNNLTGGTAANQIYTGSGAPIILQPNAALFLIYDITATKWCVVGGAGGGGLVVVATTAYAAGSTVAVASNQRQVSYIQGNGAAVTLSSTTPLQAGTIDGAELSITGRSDTYTVTILNSGTVKQNGSVTLGNGDTISYVWDATSSLWIEQGRNH